MGCEWEVHTPFGPVFLFLLFLCCSVTQQNWRVHQIALEPVEVADKGGGMDDWMLG
jgi:hypothetical protein